MSFLSPGEVSVLALLAHEGQFRSEPQKRRLVSHLKTARAQEVAKAILGRPTRSKAAKKTAQLIVDWANAH